MKKLLIFGATLCLLSASAYGFEKDCKQFVKDMQAQNRGLIESGYKLDDREAYVPSYFCTDASVIVQDDGKESYTVEVLENCFETNSKSVTTTVICTERDDLAILKINCSVDGTYLDRCVRYKIDDALDAA